MRLLPILLLSMLTVSCASSRRDWRELALPDVPLQDAWGTFERYARQTGHPAEPQETDRGLRIYVSKWSTRPMSIGRRGGMGGRTRLRAEFVPLAESRAHAGESLAGWLIRFCIERQTVKDMARTMQPDEDDWSYEGQDTDLERQLEAHLRVHFKMPLVGSE